MKKFAIIATMFLSSSAFSAVPGKINRELKATVPSESLPSPHGALPGTAKPATSSENSGVARTRSTLKSVSQAGSHVANKAAPRAEGRNSTAPAVYGK